MNKIDKVTSLSKLKMTAVRVVHDLGPILCMHTLFFTYQQQPRSAYRLVL